MNVTILRFESVDSTNLEAMRQARLGADEGLCVISMQQTAGRGRRGRRWLSPKDAGFYFSIVLRPTIKAEQLPLITMTAAIAVHDTLVEFGLKPDIKWPNDLLVNERKICGILAETTETDKGLAVIVGVGINLRSSNLPDEVAATATSIEVETGRVPEPYSIERPLPRYLAFWYDRLQQIDGPERILNEWSRRSTYFRDKAVRVTLGKNIIAGMTDGLELTGALRVRQDDGTVNVVQAGDVERVRPNDD